LCKESLEICNDSVKCQKCGIAVPLLRAVIKTRSNRIDALQKQIKWIENYSCGKINRPSYVNEVKALKQELAELLEEDAKADKLRSLPLYNCKHWLNLYVQNAMITCRYKALTYHNVYILGNQVPSTNDYKIHISSSCCHIGIINYAADNNN
jgi:hypothetical protein